MLPKLISKNCARCDDLYRVVRDGLDLRQERVSRLSAVRPDGDRPVTPRTSSGGCGKLYRARSRLYRRRSLQVNTRFAAFLKIYQII